MQTSKLGFYGLWLLLIVSADLVMCESGFAQGSKVQLPKPTGTYAVGVNVFQWVNYAEKDTFTRYSNDYREVAVQVYYPAQAGNESLSVKSRYAPLFKGADSVETNARLLIDVAATNRPFPVILVCPGRGVAKHEYSIMAEELASHGYIVASIDMPYLGDVRYLDGRVIPPHPQFRVPPAYFSGPYRRVDSFFVQASKIGATDVAFAINGLKMLNNNKRSVFFGKMDFDNMGIFGHSLGGRTAGQALGEIAGIKAYISMEGITPSDVRVNGINKPMAFIMSESLVKNAITNYEEAIPKRKHDVHIVILKEFGHNSLTDYPYTYPISAAYKVSPVVSAETGRSILRKFFDCYLNQKADFGEGIKGDPVVELRTYGKPK